MVTEHSNKACLYFKDMMILARTAYYMDHVVKEAIKIWLHPDNYSRETEFTLSRSWNPATNITCKAGTSKSNKSKDQWQIASWIVQVKQQGLWWQTTWLTTPYWSSLRQGHHTPRANCGYKYNGQSCISSCQPQQWLQRQSMKWYQLHSHTANHQEDFITLHHSSLLFITNTLLSICKSLE